MEKLREEVVANIRACLISTKGTCDLKQLRADYRMLMGCEVPFKKLNFPSLEDFVCSIKTLSVTKGAGGQILIDAKATDKTAHIVDMVVHQKTGKKKTRMPVRPDKKAYMNRSPEKRWRPKNVGSKWKNTYQNSPKLAAVSHNQFVNIPKAARKAEVPPRFNRQLSNSGGNNNDVETKDLRQYLNSKRAVSFESSDSSSSTVSSELVPHSTKTNRAALMLSLPRKHSPPVLCPIQVENFKNSSLAAVDLRSPVWDSWTSSDDSGDLSSAKLQQDKQDSVQPTGDSIVDLYNFTASRKLGDPSFKIVSRKTKPHKPAFYDCQIKVGTYTYSSYPVDFTYELAAKQHAAKLALDDLTSKYGKRKSLLLSVEQDVRDRIPPIVEKHYHGIWNWQLEADYADTFKEQLPMNWLQVIDVVPTISVEAFLDNKYVLRYCKPEDKGKRAFSGAIADVSVASNTVSFDEDGTLIATVTCAVSAKEIWCRQIDTEESDVFHSMMQNFERSYAHSRSFEGSVKGVLVGGYYAAFFEGGWYRVRVFEVDGADISCFLIDYGDEQLITKDNIYALKREFAKQQAQAFICRLAGLEELYEVSTSSEHLLALVGKTVQVDADSDEVAKNDPNDPISVVLYDIERNVSINEELISSITVESASPMLNKDGITEAYVCHVEANGNVYVHTNPSGFNKLESLIDELSTGLLEKGPDRLPASSPTPEDSKDRLYFARHKPEGRWRRVRLIDWSPDRTYVQIHFIDYGDCDIVTVKDVALYPIDELSDVVNQFPEQAVHVRMVIDSVPPDFVDKVRNLMPLDQLVLVKYVRTDNKGVPWVKFFKRVRPSNDLVSISESISFEAEQAATNPSRPEKLQRLISLNQFDDTATHKNVPSAGILKSPPLPQVGEYYDVKVPCAVNPWNFFVQPYESNERLSKLMAALQEAYCDVTYSPLQIEDIQPGNIYASKHEDGCWYRTSVIKVIHSGSISVFYCDFGYYANLTLQQLIPLAAQYVELPYQAIKAKLAGIKPKQTNLTMDDCKFFQKLVCRKSFVSILVRVDKDELYRYDTVLSLKLIDTSTDTDVHIDQILVKRGIAVDIDN